ncbi:MAG: pilin [Patescibacteria group bacterium]|nr:pilin [Patescibacteria group bacterium]
MAKFFLFLILNLIFLTLFNFNQNNYLYAQIREFIPQKISCTPFTILDVLRGQSIPPGLVGKCLLWLAQKILTLIYTVSLIISVGFIIYSGLLFATKPNDENAKKYLIWAIIGAIITILAFSIVRGIEFTLSRG